MTLPSYVDVWLEKQVRLVELRSIEAVIERDDGVGISVRCSAAWLMMMGYCVVYIEKR